MSEVSNRNRGEEIIEKKERQIKAFSIPFLQKSLIIDSVRNLIGQLRFAYLSSARFSFNAERENMMIDTISLQGSLHKQYDVPNQDAVRVFDTKGYQGLILCDGVSLKSDWTFSKSEIASALVSQAASLFLEETLNEGMETEELEQLVREAFVFAEHYLQENLEKVNIPLFDCQTTLIIALFAHGKLIGGIAGDGGILFQCKSDRFGIMITHLKTSSRVSPISDQFAWNFFVMDNAEDSVTSVIAATDGVFDQLIYLNPEEKDPQVSGDKELIEALFNLNQTAPENPHEWLANCIENLQGHDDKTIAILIDEEQKTEQRDHVE